MLYTSAEARFPDTQVQCLPRSRVDSASTKLMQCSLNVSANRALAAFVFVHDLLVVELVSKRIH